MEPIDKAAARAFGEGARANIGADERRRASAVITKSALTWLEQKGMRRIHLFMSIERNFEIDTRPLLSGLLTAAHGYKVYAPRMEGSRMLHAPVTAETAFEISAYGIPEPAAQDATRGGTFDLIFVPLLAFDDTGHRVGYGGGHYDRFLAEQKGAIKVGLAYEACRLVGRAIAADSTDVALDLIITEASELRP